MCLEKVHCFQHYCPDVPVKSVHHNDDEWLVHSRRSVQEKGGHCRICYAVLSAVRDMDKAALVDSMRAYRCLGCLDRADSIQTQTLPSG